jgi:CcmD family protein
MKSLLLNILLQAPQRSADMADAQGTGKIEVVAAVLAVIFAGIIVYMVSVDRKIKKLEK